MKPLFTILFLLIAAVGPLTAAPDDPSTYPKLILGKWLGPKKYEIYYPDGTWAVQRNEGAKPDKEGRRWHVEGNKLTRRFSGGNATETIISMSKDEFITADEGVKTEYTRVLEKKSSKSLGSN